MTHSSLSTDVARVIISTPTGNVVNVVEGVTSLDDHGGGGTNLKVVELLVGGIKCGADAGLQELDVNELDGKTGGTRYWVDEVVELKGAGCAGLVDDSDILAASDELVHIKDLRARNDWLA